MPTSGDRDATDLTALLAELRHLYRRHPTENAPGEFRRASDAYRAALDTLSQIPERQRRNVYEQTLYTNATLADAIDAANLREATRTVRINEEGLRVETVQSWGRAAGDVEVYDTQTGELIVRREAVAPECIEGVCTVLFTEIWHDRQPKCDRCYVQPDGTRDDGTTCPCSVREPAGGCRCQASPAEWHGPTYVRAELAAQEV